MDYLKIWFDMEEYLEDLTDEEAGLLFRACMAYGKDPQNAPEFSGALRSVWRAFRRMIDDSAAEYGRKSKAGKMGGDAPKKAKAESGAKQTEADESRAKQNEADESSASGLLDQEQEQDQEQYRPTHYTISVLSNGEGTRAREAGQEFSTRLSTGYPQSFPQPADERPRAIYWDPADPDRMDGSWKRDGPARRAIVQRLLDHCDHESQLESMGEILSMAMGLGVPPNELCRAGEGSGTDFEWLSAVSHAVHERGRRFRDPAWDLADDAWTAKGGAVI